MSPAAMVALRQAAALVHALPGLCLRISGGDRTLLEVGPPSLVEGPAMGPCAFRMAVARGHEQLKQGARLAFLGLDEAEEVRVEVGLRPGDAALPGGIYRVASGDVHVQAFTTTLPLRRCRQLLADRPAPAGADDGVGLRHDTATEVTVVHTAGPPGPTTAAQLTLLEDALACLVADELLRELTTVGR